YGYGSFGPAAFRWTQSSGMGGFGGLPGGQNDGATLCMSANGLVILGLGHAASGILEAVCLTPTNRLVRLGFLFTGTFSEANAASADGSVVVGESDGEAFYWTQARGMRSIRDMLLHDHGLDITGWRLELASGVSADGKTIVGSGRNPRGQPEAWLVHI